MTTMTPERLDYVAERSKLFGDKDAVEWTDFAPSLTHGELQFLVATARRAARALEMALEVDNSDYHECGPNDMQGCGCDADQLRRISTVLRGEK